MLARLLPNVPNVAALLGLAGVLPFAAAALLSFSDGETGPRAAFALLAYGAVILSFLGGIHWGVALAGGRPGVRELTIGVVPSLVGWAALLISGRAGILLLAAGFLAVLAVDLTLVREGAVPAWFGRLRVVLTSAVCVCLSAAALA